MIRSMTGFGRADFEVGSVRFAIEVRSVNHRHLDARVRLPRPLAALEIELRARIAPRVARGKVDVTVVAGSGGGLPQALEIDFEAAREYQRAAGVLAQTEHLPGRLDVATLLGLPGVARLADPVLPEDELRSALDAALEKALDALDAMRGAEGAAIEQDLSARLDRVAALSDALEARAGVVAETVRERLRKRAQQLARETGLVDEARLHQEIVIAADRLDVTEEIVRLRSHVDQFRAIVAGADLGTPVGRRLDFLLQELVRETNTIGSKGSDAPIAHDVVELKTELERLREQVQNVE